MTIDELLSRLEDVKPAGADKWIARCPCTQNHEHGDQNRSFSIKHDTATGHILVHCHKGCSVDEICAAMDCTPGDLMPEPTSTERRDNFLNWYAKQNGLTLQAVYSYCYGNHADGLAKVRFRNAEGRKDFRWIKEDPTTKSGFKMSHDGCPHRLYFAGTYDSNTVFITEGEKDADTLHRIMQCTVASAENGAGKNSGGGKWRDEYTQQLEGKTVFILWDNDDAGKAFAEVEAAALDGHAAHVTMLDIASGWKDCPNKGDISDMVEALGDAQAVKIIADLIGAAEERPQTAQPQEDIEEHPEPPKNEAQAAEIALSQFDSFLAKVQGTAYKPMRTGMPDFDKLLGGGILRQSLIILSAAPGTGKTTLAQQIFETAATDGTDVLFLNLEMSREQLLARSLSRIAHKRGHLMSAADILKGYDWTERQRTIVQAAADEYRSKIAPRMQYNPDGNGTDLDSIMETLDASGEAALMHGKPAPVVVLDYLHLVTSSRREDSGEIIKRTVARLKDYAMRYDTYVFAISANNRTSNSSGIISQSSGRDTSAIEYSADYQLSLNYRAFWSKEEIPVDYMGEDGRMHTKNEKADASNPDHLEVLMKQQPRQMYVQVLKSRMTEPGGKLFLAFDAQHSTFTPIDTRRTGPNNIIPFGKEQDIPWI